jgi:hypothetical protein
MFWGADPRASPSERRYMIGPAGYYLLRRGLRIRDPKQSSGRFRIRRLAYATWCLIIHSALARNRVRSPHQLLRQCLLQIFFGPSSAYHVQDGVHDLGYRAAEASGRLGYA